MKELKWAVLGCGVLANQLAEAMAKEGRRLCGIANRTHAKALAFAEKYGVGKVYNSIDDMFNDDDIDIIYITTPHNTHREYMLKALNSGKHVLCEKSITLNSEELSEAKAASEKNNLALGEAMTIFHMPIYTELKRRAESGEFGELRMIQMNFGSYKDYDMSNRFFNRSLAGGALLDIGVYAISFARWFMSECPDKVLSQIRPAPTGVDEQAGILLMNSKNEMATIALSLHAKQPKRGTVSFDKAYIEIYEYPRADEAAITYTADGRRETIHAGSTEDALVYEIRDMEKAVNGMKKIMHLDYSEDVMKIMTDIRKEHGLTYPEEEYK